MSEGRRGARLLHAGHCELLGAAALLEDAVAVLREPGRSGGARARAAEAREEAQGRQAEQRRERERG